MCARCSELEEEVRQLRRELGYEVNRAKATKLALSLGLTFYEACVVMAHYEAKEHVPNLYMINDVLPTLSGEERADPSNFIKVLARKIRVKLGREALVTVWGRGYVLGAEMRQRVAQVLAA